MKNYIVLALAIGIFCIVGCASKINPEAEKAAMASAQGWLELIDSDKYAESWEEAAENFKSAISKDKWQETIQALRKPLGKVISRDVHIIQYKTSFENKKDAIETITLMLDKDGKWKVAGYYIK